MSYRIEREGDFSLPAISVKWWDSVKRTVHTSQVPAITFKAIANSSYTPVFSVVEDLRQLGQPTRLYLPGSVLAAGSVLLLAALAYLSRRRMQQGITTARHWLRSRPPRKTWGLRPLNPVHEKDFPK